MSEAARIFAEGITKFYRAAADRLTDNQVTGSDIPSAQISPLDETRARGWTRPPKDSPRLS